MNRFSLEKKTIIVTGALGGNGGAIARALEKEGAFVCKADLPEYDLKNNRDMQKLVDSYERIDGLVNAAGITRGNNIFEYQEKDWDDTLSINLKTPFLLSRYVATKMKDNGGSIVNITSLNSELGFPNNPAYIASKGGLKQLTRSLALDLGKYGIRVNNLGPGYIRTDMTKLGWANNREKIEDRTILGRWGTPEDLVGAAIFLLSDASAYMTGQDLYIDGGYLAKGL